MKSLSFKTKFGWITAFEEKGKIVRIKFAKHRNKSISKNLMNLKNKINDFFNKKNKTVKSNFLIIGNNIQKKVWKELLNIKLGKTKSYGEIAKKYKLSPRHVGKICGQNNFLIAVPCHRVIRSDGSLGGFSSPGGLKLKKKLLDFERSWKY
jgi:O-6-methylguanine DNA methyltransferase